uniref:Uncharacterized protein n=3 Tax=Octopus bimaculoides TaxID=37653 RepID=A0A0L8GUU2_OCTBM
MAASKLTWSYLPQTLLCFAVFISNFLVVYSDNILNNNSTNNAESKLPPTVLIALAVRNEGHALPWVLGQLEILNYPKDRISFW